METKIKLENSTKKRENKLPGIKQENQQKQRF
jgi:hypothetical protein